MFFNKLRRRSDKLIKISRIFTINSLVPILKKSKVLSDIRFNQNDWDFFVTVACVRYGIQCLPMGEVSKEDFKTLCDFILQNLSKVDNQMLPAFNDLNSYIELTSETLNNLEKHVMIGIGMWIIINLKQNTELSNDELELSEMIVHFMHAHVHDWW